MVLHQGWAWVDPSMQTGDVCVSIRTHITVTAGRNFLILVMMLGYDVGLMRLIYKF